MANKTSKTPKRPAAKATAAVESPGKRKAKEITTQYAVLAAKASDFVREAIKFGALLVDWEQFLGKSQGGRDTKGEGLKGWLEQYCPEINYATAIKYKLLAEKNAAMLGGGAMALAALQGETTVTQPDGVVIDVESKVVAKRDEIFAEASSFSKLEQAYFAFMAESAGTPDAKRGGRPKAAAEPIRKLSRRDEARKIWTDVVVILSKNSVRDAIPLLDDAKEVRVCYEKLRDLADAMKAHLDEFRN